MTAQAWVAVALWAEVAISFLVWLVALYVVVGLAARDRRAARARATEDAARDAALSRLRRAAEKYL